MKVSTKAHVCMFYDDWASGDMHSWDRVNAHTPRKAAKQYIDNRYFECRSTDTTEVVVVIDPTNKIHFVTVIA